MPNRSRALLAQRADQRMYEVELTAQCPVCGEAISVSVYGASDVEITDECSGACHRRKGYPWAVLEEDAIGRAQGQRADYLRHLEESE